MSAVIFTYGSSSWKSAWSNGSKKMESAEFKFWTKLFALYFVLMPLGKVWIYHLSPTLSSWRTDWILLPWLRNQSPRRKTLNSNQQYSSEETDLVLNTCRNRGHTNVLQTYQNVAGRTPRNVVNLWGHFSPHKVILRLFFILQGFSLSEYSWVSW